MACRETAVPQTSWAGCPHQRPAPSHLRPKRTRTPGQHRELSQTHATSKRSLPLNMTRRPDPAACRGRAPDIQDDPALSASGEGQVSVQPVHCLPRPCCPHALPTPARRA